MRVLVIAPHQDDEVLACGGTIIKRIREGHQLFIAFMTDGSRAFGKNADPEKIKSIRKQEAFHATKAMGVKRENLHFLDLHDGKLSEEIVEVQKRLLDMLPIIRPSEVFLPNHDDSHMDHCAANEAVLFVLKKAKFTGDICEYVVWDADIKKRPDKVMLKYNAAENIQDVRELKKLALFEYKCQTTVYFPWQEKPMISEEFMGRFLNGREYFIKYRMVRGKKALPNAILDPWRRWFSEVRYAFARTRKSIIYK